MVQSGSSWLYQYARFEKLGDPRTETLNLTTGRLLVKARRFRFRLNSSLLNPVTHPPINMSRNADFQSFRCSHSNFEFISCIIFHPKIHFEKQVFLPLWNIFNEHHALINDLSIIFKICTASHILDFYIKICLKMDPKSEKKLLCRYNDK